MLDATRDNNEKYNVNMLQGLDTHNQNIGLDTPLDKMFYENILEQFKRILGRR